MVTTPSLPSPLLDLRPADELRGQIQRLLVRNRALLVAAAETRATEVQLRDRIEELMASLALAYSAPIVAAPVAAPAVKAPKVKVSKGLDFAAALKLCRSTLHGHVPTPGQPAIEARKVGDKGGACEARAAVPARLLGCVRIDGVNGVAVVSACDLANRLVVTTVTPWPVGSVRVIEGKALAALKGDISPAPGLDVRVGGATIQGWDAAGWPVTPGLEGGLMVTLDGATLASALRRILPCVAPEDNRYGLNGAHVEVVGDDTRLVGCDGNRLAWATVPGTWALPHGMILPRPAIVALLPVLAGSVSIRTGDRMIEVQAGPVAATVRLLEADFPDYRQVLPSTWTWRATVDRDALAAAVERVAVLATGLNRMIRITAVDDSMILHASTLAVGEISAEVPANMDGGPRVIGLNARFLLDALAGLAGELVIETGNELSPVTIRSLADPSALFVVMPVAE